MQSRPRCAEARASAPRLGPGGLSPRAPDDFESHLRTSFQPQSPAPLFRATCDRLAETALVHAKSATAPLRPRRVRPSENSSVRSEDRFLHRAKYLSAEVPCRNVCPDRSSPPDFAP